ncbi:putative transmembrane protein [Senna tora]|uniref:Putative transmembrane protein n=1 Tax=Senna tora TaxID=362788 RepID=A0A834TP19_9FABA|nr:putative transmembrane protein [Senna tora]
MHRSASWNRYSDDYFKQFATSQSPGLRYPPPSSSSEGSELPLYDPVVELAKKEKARVRFSENAVHVIPFVLFACAIILWFFSNPVDVEIKGDSIKARIEGLSIEGEIDNDSDGSQMGVLAAQTFTRDFGAEKISTKLKTF